MVFRCLYDGFLGQVHGYIGILITDTPDTLWGNRDLLAGKPMARLNDEQTNRPIFIVDYKIGDVANLSFAGLELAFFYRSSSVKILQSIGPLILRQVFRFCYTLLHQF